MSSRPGLARGQAGLRHLELTITRRLDGLLQGDHQGLVPGSGSEPGEGREYQPGDDVRRMDWNVTVPASPGEGITITVEDIKGLTTTTTVVAP